jgi:glutaredoxin
MSEANTITVLSTPTCQRCKIVAKHLESRGVEFNYVNVQEDAEWAAWMQENSLTNVPQTIKGDARVEGVDFDAINRLF